MKYIYTAVCLVFLAGCGSDDASSNGTTTATTSGTETAVSQTSITVYPGTVYTLEEGDQVVPQSSDANVTFYDDPATGSKSVELHSGSAVIVKAQN